MKVSAKLNNLRIAPRKTKLVADLIRGLDVSEAFNQLNSSIKGAVSPIKKLLESAVANGENNFGIDKGNMYICDVKVGAGPVFKRWMPKAFGRAGQILKRTSKIEIVLEERIEGKNRKTKEQMEKEKKEKAQEKLKEEKKRAKEAEGKEEKPTAGIKTEKPAELDKEESYGKKEAKKRGWANKIFRRKSM